MFIPDPGSRIPDPKKHGEVKKGHFSNYRTQKTTRAKKGKKILKIKKML
jgi:hypothetical protein